MPLTAWDQMKSELANTNRKVNPSDRWRTTSWFLQPLSAVFPPQIQHSSVLFKLGETQSAFLLYFSSYILRPSYFLCWVASHQKTCEPVVLGTTKLEIQDALICIHICVMKTQHPVWLMLPCIILSARGSAECVCEFQPLWVWVCICVCLAVQSQSDTQSAALETMSLCCRAGNCGALNADDALTRVLGVSFWQMDSPRFSQPVCLTECLRDCIITFVANK